MSVEIRWLPHKLKAKRLRTPGHVTFFVFTKLRAVGVVDRTNVSFIYNRV